MKKSLFLVFLLPATCFADRLGSLKASSNVLLSTQAASPAGSNSSVQFNNSGALGGDSGFQYDSSVSSVTITGALGVSGTLLNDRPSVSPGPFASRAALSFDPSSSDPTIQTRSYNVVAPNHYWNIYDYQGNNPGALDFAIGNGASFAVQVASCTTCTKTNGYVLSGNTGVHQILATKGSNLGNPLVTFDSVGNSSFTTPVAITGLAAGQCVQTGAGGLLTVTGSACGSGGGGMTPGSTNYIQNSNTLQTGSTFYVSSGTVSGNLTANQHISIATTTSATINQVSFYSATKKATIWTTADHGFRVGRVVRISGLTNTALNSTATITAVPTSTTFNYYVYSNVDISTTSDSGTAESYTGSIVSFQAKDSLNLYSVKISPYANGVGNYLTATTPLSGDYPIEITNSEVGSYGANYNYSINPWIAYRFNNTSTSNIARIAARASYTGSTPYDVAAIDLSNSAGGSISFYTGGTFNGGSLTLAGTFGKDGSLSLYKPFRLTDSSTQNAQFGYTNNLDSSASLFLGTNSNKGLVLQLPQYQFTNAFELQKAGGNTVDAGISYLGNWWIGGTSGSSTSRLVVSPRQTTDVALTVKGRSSQTGNLQEWQNSSSVVLSSVSASGNATFPTVTASTVTATSVMIPPSKTLAQLTALAPTQPGIIFYCSDCTTDGIVVSTGTATGAFGRISSRSTQIQ